MRRKEGPFFIPVSARSETTVILRLKQLLDWLEGEEATCSLGDVAYTLLVGRTHYHVRFALVADSLQDLRQKAADTIRAGAAAIQRRPVQRLSPEEGNLLLAELSEHPDPESQAYRDGLSVVAGLYVAGHDLEWGRLYANDRFRRVTLPAYPYERERFWVAGQEAVVAAPTTVRVEALHPLLDSDRSTSAEYRFQKRLRGDEFFVRDHVVGGEKVLPGVAHLEMARVAGELTGPQRRVWKIKDVRWIVPVKIPAQESNTEVRIALTPVGASDELHYVIGDMGEYGASVMYSQGTLVLKGTGQAEQRPQLDMESIRQRSTGWMTGADCLRIVNQGAYYPGPTFQSVQELWYNQEEALAHLSLPPGVREGAEPYRLHPSLLDGAFQSVVGLVGDDGLSMPVGLEEIEIFDSIPAQCFAYTRPAVAASSGERRFDIQIADLHGRVVATVRGFRFRLLHAARPEPALASSAPLYARIRWEEAPLPVASAPVAGDILLFDTDTHLHEALLRSPACQAGVRAFLVMPGEVYQGLQEDRYEIDPGNAGDYQMLVDDLERRGISPSTILFRWANHSGSMQGAKAAGLLKRGFYAALFLARALGSRKDLRILYLHPGDAGVCGALHEAMRGFARSVMREHQNWWVQVVEAEPARTPAQVADLCLAELSAGAPEMGVRYHRGQRLVRRIEAFEPGATGSLGTFQPNGVYLITGGTGGLGLAMAQHIAKQPGAVVVLSGRTLPSPEQQRRIDAIQAPGVRVAFIRADVSKESDVKNLVAEIKERFRSLNGVIHCAGVTRDAAIADKTAEMAKEVLAPKVFGTLYLDEATKDEPLDLFVLFSSVAGISGNLGQCDYAFANSFMDHFAWEREQMRSAGQRQGRTLSVNWPLWAEGGMQVDRHTQTMLLNTFGMVPLSTKDGLDGLQRALACGEPQVIIAMGEHTKLRRTLGLAKEAQQQRKADAPSATEFLQEAVPRELVRLVVATIKIKEKHIDLEWEMSKYGFDSITLTDLINRVNLKFGLSLTPAIFFEHTTLASLAKFLMTNFVAELSQALMPKDETSAHLPAQVAQPAVPPLAAAAVAVSSAPAPRREPEPLSAPARPNVEEPIAIIGMSGMFPGSDDLESFWNNLVAERNLITEVPSDRWDWREYYSESNQGINKSATARWGGFMQDAYKFDHAFFGISPREVELMDPQQRLFLEICWKSIEDAGYAPKTLSGTKTGIFAGVFTFDYFDLLKENRVAAEPYLSTGVAHCVLTNRASYFYNFQGPSEPVDTACSSSLVALHRAVESIRNGECDQAIVGGVNVMASPTLFVALGQAGMLSPDGACKTFDKRANGYVRGEGAGAILLKPLHRAIADGDHIYGLVRGTAVNHGGHANTLTSPNPIAQEELLIRAYERAGISPSTVSYIEAHGTGTSLGDPVEVNALKKAFAKLTQKWGIPPAREPYCGLSSVKTNIGHLEAASGIVGIIKVLLAMKHRILPGTVHFQERNPYIEIEGSPFYIVERTKGWEPLKDQEGRELPLRAGVSSFGFGGSNAHIVLEEYVESQPDRVQETGGKHVVVLSAKTEERLSVSAANLARFLRARSLGAAAMDQAALQKVLTGVLARVLHVSEDEIDGGALFMEYGLDKHGQTQFAELLKTEYQVELDSSAWHHCIDLEELAAYLVRSMSGKGGKGGKAEEEIALPDLAYTLQVGRQAFEARMAAVVGSTNELIAILDRYSRGETEVTHLYTGNLSRGKKAAAPSDAELAKEAVAQGDLAEVAALWVRGVEVDWALLHQGRRPARLALPTYPFERTKHRVPTGPSQTRTERVETLLHPLLHRNTSTLREHRFTSVFSGNEFFLADHRVDGHRVLPGVALMEMARAAGERAAERPVTGLRNVLWAAPVMIGDGALEVHVMVQPAGESLRFEVYSLRQGHRVVHGQGTLLFDPLAKEQGQAADMAAIRKRCTGQVGGEAYYARFNGKGLTLGGSFQSIRSLMYNRHEAFAELVLPSARADTFSQYTLHPSLMDGAVESIIGLFDAADQEAIYMPFALGELRIIRPIRERCYAYAAVRDKGTANSDLQKFDIKLLDEHGNALVLFQDFAAKQAGGKSRGPSPNTELLTLLKRLAAGELKAADVVQHLGVTNRES